MDEIDLEVDSLLVIEPVGDIVLYDSPCVVSLGVLFLDYRVDSFGWVETDVVHLSFGKLGVDMALEHERVPIVDHVSVWLNLDLLF